MTMPRGTPLRPVGVVVVVVAVAVAGWLVTRGGDAGGSASDDAAAVVTAPVERRVLESLLVTRGTVLAPSQATVRAGAPGERELAVVVTGTPVPRGSEVVAGGVVVEVNGRPVFALPGVIPVYRDMRPGDSGPDVAAVQEALQSFGHEVHQTERATATFGSSTQRAVQGVYENAGYEPAYTLGSREAVADAESEVDDGVAAAQAAVDSVTAPSDAGAEPAAEAPSSSDAVRAAQDQLDAAVDARDTVRAAEGVMLPAREFVAVPSLPASVVELPAQVGESVEPGLPIATIGSNQFQVRVELTSAQVNELADDTVISVFSDHGYEASCPAVAPRPEGTGDGGGETGSEGASGSPPADAGTVDAAADDASAVDTAGEGGASDDAGGGSDGAPVSGEAYVMDVVCDPLPPADSLGSSLRVTMTVRRSAGEVLVVPATAVTTTSTGAVFVEVIGSDGESTRVEVAIGGEADGFVEVTPVDGAALLDGMDVRVRRI